jgi:formate hydrogenlyase transcriptional activator
MDFTNLGDFAATGLVNVSGLGDQQLHLESEISPEYSFEGIIGKSPAIQKVLEEVAIVAPTDSTVLLHGETGTGKELIARAIHSLSARRERAFVRMNCAAIPSGLLESELFGHEKGAFTGALMQRKGRFELADGGSFLDDRRYQPELQPKLLRAIQEQEFERLGTQDDQRERAADCRHASRSPSHDSGREVPRGSFLSIHRLPD